MEQAACAPQMVRRKPHAGEDIWQRWSDDEQEPENSDFSVLEPDGDGVSLCEQDS
jgi:hypothetical protein